MGEIISEWKTFSVTTLQSRSGQPREKTPSASRHLVRPVHMNLVETSAILQGSMLNFGISMLKSTVRRNMNAAGLHVRMPGRKTLVKKKHKQACFNYTKTHIDKLKASWQKVFFIFIWVSPK